MNFGCILASSQLEPGYENNRRPLAVHTMVYQWYEEWCEIADKKLPDSWFEKEITDFESRLIKNIYSDINQTLSANFKVRYFKDNEEKLFINE
ncbi:hypothetical protein [Pleionea sediminis]|uniref:hypothetical protein n=1 Tax=Pleionea sediminis TaxID=2569479 RepID=UPI0011871A55|nr:hypothetical protein [Pleionea sediminis]